MRVAELVPEISDVPRFRVRAYEMTLVAAGRVNDALEHRQVRGNRLVKASDDRVDDAKWSIVCDDETRPTLARRGRAALVGDSLERANDGGTDRDDAVSATPGGVDPLRCFRRHAIELLVRWFMVF